MSMLRVHSLGDSWTCIEAGGTNQGWQVYAGLFPEHRHGIPGSTAAQWADDEGGILTSAIHTMTAGDIVFVSLSGNDFRHAISDGKLTPQEVEAACDNLAVVIVRLRTAGVHVIVMGYANPYHGNDVAAAWGNSLCAMIRRIANDSNAKYFDVARHLVMPDHFDGKDSHPTAAGHKAIAAAVEQEVNG